MDIVGRYLGSNAVGRYVPYAQLRVRAPERFWPATANGWPLPIAACEVCTSTRVGTLSVCRQMYTNVLR